MKPEWVSEEDYARYRHQGRETLRKERMEWMGETGIELCAAGDWLSDQLEAMGVVGDENYAVCVAFGQACLGREPWATAQATLAKWKAGRAPAPGIELADALLSGSVDGLPPGGVVIQ